MFCDSYNLVVDEQIEEFLRKWKNRHSLLLSGVIRSTFILILTRVFTFYQNYLIVINGLSKRLWTTLIQYLPITIRMLKKSGEIENRWTEFKEYSVTSNLWLIDFRGDNTCIARAQVGGRVLGGWSYSLQSDNRLRELSRQTSVPVAYLGGREK